MAVKNMVNATIAAQGLTAANRSHRLTIVRQFLGGALGSQSRMAALLAAVPGIVTTAQVSNAGTPTERKTKPGPKPSTAVTAAPNKIVGTKIAGTKTRRRRMSA